ncbi:PQQ-binding-like beta-propeller repeat protein [Actinacidiphila sp. bgisy160]|uniref:PQQ-binding-like beta-propeller repeat protein n=1 Tax=Actinacidiphila sp. bgisy160 TaxID=3413796 RepID=UPI003D766267
MPESLVVRRVLGDRPFAEIGEPGVAAVDERLGCLVVGGDMGWIAWPNPGRAPIDRWPRYRIGVYDADDLRCRHVYDCQWPVMSVAFHPLLPLAAVGVGRYDGSWDFEGQLLLMDLESGRVRPLLDDGRQVTFVRWLDARRLRLVVSPEDKDSAHAFSHGFEAVLERHDWRAVPPRSVGRREVTGPRVRYEGPPDRDRARDLLTERSRRIPGTVWAPRRQVRAVEVLGDGRVLATVEGARLECWLPSGDLQWSVPDLDGARQIHVGADEASAWVNVQHTVRPAGSGWQGHGTLVERLSLADGRSLEAFDPGHAVTFAASRDGRLVIRAGSPDQRGGETRLLAPDGTELTRFTLTASDFRLRRGADPLFVQDLHTRPGSRAWIGALTIGEPGAEPGLRRLFALDWESGRGSHLFPGPAVQLGDAALVHAAVVRDHEEVHARNAFVVRRRLPDGAPRWVFAADEPVTALDADEDTVYAAHRSGEVVGLDPRTGSPRLRHRLRVGGQVVVPLSLAAAGAGRLLVGTVDGRILDCAPASPAGPAVTSAGE